MSFKWLKTFFVIGAFFFAGRHLSSSTNSTNIVTQSSLRAIASVYEQVTQPDKVSKKPKKVKEIFKIDCRSLRLAKQNESHQTIEDRVIDQSSEVVLLKFENCKNNEFSDLKIFNEVNGYNAEIYRHNKIIVSTDFIQLSSAENYLKLEFSLKPEQKVTHQIKITRHLQ